jgi:hypothetical protein
LFGRVTFLKKLLEDLEGHRWSHEEDGCIWRAEEGGVFTVNSTYRKLERLLVLKGDRSTMEEHVFGHVWKSPTPLKVIAFS